MAAGCGGGEGELYAVGTRVKVFFDDGRWYDGKVVSKRLAKGDYEVLFDDGERLHLRIPDAVRFICSRVCVCVCVCVGV